MRCRSKRGDSNGKDTKGKSDSEGGTNRKGDTEGKESKGGDSEGEDSDGQGRKGKIDPDNDDDMDGETAESNQ